VQVPTSHPFLIYQELSVRYLELSVCDVILNPNYLFSTVLAEMANITRRAKYGREWNIIDLAAYNIRVQFQDATTFFGMPRLPDPVITPQEVLEVLEADRTTTDDGYVLLRLLDAAMSRMQNEESAVHDFAAELLRACGYSGRGRLIRTRKDIFFYTCGESKYARADACILNDKNEIILLVHEDKEHLDDANDPEPQLIAEAIAAFGENKYKFGRSWYKRLQSKTMPGIILNGNTPISYKVPVSDDLVDAVSRGLYPQQETVVLAHRPLLPPRPLMPYYGDRCMKPLDNRRVILSCIEAFKQFVN
jgi:hypothetical protein